MILMHYTRSWRANRTTTVQIMLEGGKKGKKKTTPTQTTDILVYSREGSKGGLDLGTTNSGTSGESCGVVEERVVA